MVERDGSSPVRRDFLQPTGLVRPFGSREGVLTAVAIEGFTEIGLALERARKRANRGSAIEAFVSAYLAFAAASPALYEVMFSLNVSVPFDDPATPSELRFAFAQVFELFHAQDAKADVLSESFWASLHGIAELTRTKRFPRSRQKSGSRASLSVSLSNDSLRSHRASNVIVSDGSVADPSQPLRNTSKMKSGVPCSNETHAVRSYYFNPYRVAGLPVSNVACNSAPAAASKLRSRASS